MYECNLKLRMHLYKCIYIEKKTESILWSLLLS